MTFNPLDQALTQLLDQSAWDSYKQYRRLLIAWEQVVEEKVARQTRPLYINRNILWVATSSAVWAQTLSLSRLALITRLSDRLEVPLDDIRFSTARWSDRSPAERAADSATTHPSHIDHPDFVIAADLGSQPISSQAAFERWFAIIQWRSHFLTPCPRCQIPTPAGEIERWSMCAYCIRREWGNSSSPEKT